VFLVTITVFVFDCNIQCQISSNVSIHDNLTAGNSSLNTHFFLFCCLMYSPVGVPLAAVNNHTQTTFSTVPTFQMESILTEPSSLFIGKASEVFGGRNPNGNAENEVSMTLHRTALYDEISCCKISMLFFPFSLPRNFLQLFSNASKVRLSVALNFVLKTWSLNSCLIYGPMKIPYFFLGSLMMGSLCLKYA